MLKLLMIGDVIGRPGRKAVEEVLPSLRSGLDFVVANGENLAHGAGITRATAQELFDCGVDAITLGNHAWDKKEVHEIIEDERILRPANYPRGVPGKGHHVFETPSGKIGVLNLMGRVYLPDTNCPFRCADELLSDMRKESLVILVDMHAEVTSEKNAMGWYLDGRVSAVGGTHTHIQTADERILPQGTAFITDIGMSGPYNSIIGMDKEAVLKRFLTGMPVRFEVADGARIFCAILVEVDPDTGKALSIQRMKKILE